MSQPYGMSFKAMGSRFNIWLETASDGAAILRRVPAWVEAIEASLSRFRPESELSHLNRRSGKWVAVSDILLKATLEARRAAHLSEGLCNPLVLPALLAVGYTRSFDRMAPDQDQPAAPPSPAPDWHGIEIRPKQSAIRLPAGAQLDLGGTAKGWTAAQIASRLSEYGPCLVDAGGDLAGRGQPQGQPGWVVRVAEPGAVEDQPPLASVMIANSTIVTSGTDYRRWVANGKPQHHLIDPRTGQPAATDVLSATVIHSDPVLAEAYAKALVLLGSQAGFEWIERQPQKAALVVRTDGAVLVNADFQSRIVSSVLIH